jgi:hypothetical protein
MAGGELAERWAKYKQRVNTDDVEYAAALFIVVLDLLDALEVVPSAGADLEVDLIDEDAGAEFVGRFIDRTLHLGIPSLSPRIRHLPASGPHQERL